MQVYYEAEGRVLSAQSSKHGMARQSQSLTPSLQTAIILSSLILPIAAVSKTAACYDPDGSFLANDAACNLDADVSSCCGIGWSCLSNGVCEIVQEQNSVNVTLYYRGSCTDQTWTQPGCLNICRDGTPGIQGTSISF